MIFFTSTAEPFTPSTAFPTPPYGHRHHTPPRRDQGHSPSRDRSRRPPRARRRRGRNRPRGQRRNRAHLRPRRKPWPARCSRSRRPRPANKVTALALNLEEDNIGAVILGDYLQLKEGDEVRRTVARARGAGRAGAGRPRRRRARPSDRRHGRRSTRSTTRKVESRRRASSSASR